MSRRKSTLELMDERLAGARAHLSGKGRPTEGDDDMARTKARKGKGRGNGIGHNSAEGADDDGTFIHETGARHAAIRMGFLEIHRTEEDIARMTEEHLKDLKEARTRMWRELKAATGTTRKILEAEYRVWKIAKEAQDNDEDGSSQKTLDDIRDVFAALHKGEQLDWIAALDG